jgi:hypothetical protein
MFVKPTTGQRCVVYANDDVAERYGTEATTTWEHQEASSDAPAGNFDGTFDHTSVGTDGERK